MTLAHVWVSGAVARVVRWVLNHRFPIVRAPRPPSKFAMERITIAVRPPLTVHQTPSWEATATVMIPISASRECTSASEEPLFVRIQPMVRPNCVIPWTMIATHRPKMESRRLNTEQPAMVTTKICA